jgi:hypothetical protein
MFIFGDGKQVMDLVKIHVEIADPRGVAHHKTGLCIF